jgi:hypothetical protein
MPEAPESVKTGFLRHHVNRNHGFGGTSNAGYILTLLGNMQTKNLRLVIQTRRH